MSDKEKRIEILGMFKRGKKVMEISRELGLPHSTVSKAIKRFNELGTSADRKGRGRKKTARTPQMIRTIKRKVQRGEDNKRKMAREEGISERTVRRIVKEDMKSKSYKKQEAHFLDEDDEETIEELKAALQEAWERIDQNVLASSVDNWRKRLRACVQANGGYFEI